MTPTTLKNLFSPTIAVFLFSDHGHSLAHVLVGSLAQADAVLDAANRWLASDEEHTTSRVYLGTVQTAEGVQ